MSKGRAKKYMLLSSSFVRGNGTVTVGGIDKFYMLLGMALNSRVKNR